MTRLNRHLILLTLLLFATTAWGQDGRFGYQFLHVPVSSHSAALGGANISIVEDDASMMWTNAALMTNVSDNTIWLGYNSYILRATSSRQAMPKPSGNAAHGASVR